MNEKAINDALIVRLRKRAEVARAENRFGDEGDMLDAAEALAALPHLPAGREEIARGQICGACGLPWTGEKCGQAENDHPFPTCYPVSLPASYREKGMRK